MAIQAVMMKCPACGADIPMEDGQRTVYCSYCGSKLMLQNDNEHIIRNIDEARVKEAETERILKLRALDIQEQEKARIRRMKGLSYKTALGIGAVGLVFLLFLPALGVLLTLLAMALAFITFVKEDHQTPTRVLQEDEIVITEGLCNCKKMHFEQVIGIFRNAGFQNVRSVPIRDLSVFQSKKEGLVESVTLDGDMDFFIGDIYSKYADVLITYHSR